nr:gag-pol polyprotein [Ipomoea batatas]
MVFGGNHTMVYARNQNALVSSVEEEHCSGPAERKPDQYSGFHVVYMLKEAGKQTRTTHPALKEINTKHFLELIHLDLMGPTQTESIGGSLDAALESSTPDPRTVQIYNPDSGLAAPTRIQKNHPVQNIIGDPNSRVQTRGKKRDYSELPEYVCYTSKLEPKNMKETLTDEH